MMTKRRKRRRRRKGRRRKPDDQTKSVNGGREARRDRSAQPNFEWRRMNTVFIEQCKLVVVLSNAPSTNQQCLLIARAQSKLCSHFKWRGWKSVAKSRVLTSENGRWNHFRKPFFILLKSCQWTFWVKVKGITNSNAKSENWFSFNRKIVGNTFFNVVLGIKKVFIENSWNIQCIFYIV